MCPCPEAATDGIQYPRALTLAASKRVPDWKSTGVVLRLRSSYQREAFRDPFVAATPFVPTRMLWAVQRLLLPVALFFFTCAANSRSSRASRRRLFAVPADTCLIGQYVSGTVSGRSGEIDGVPPGSLTRRTSRSEKSWKSTPTK